MKYQQGKILVGILLVFLILGGLGGGYFYFFKSSDSDTSSEAFEESGDAAPIELTDPIFVAVGPFTVNVMSSRGDRLLYTSMMLQVNNEQTEEFLQKHMPAINNRLLILLSEQIADELNVLGGKEMVKQKILEVFKTPFSVPQPDLSIQDVLFQEFIVQ